MSSVFPLVRAADIIPFLRWMRDNGRPLEPALGLAGLPVAPWDAPDRPIALTGAFAVMRYLTEQEGPDIACRVVSESSISDLGELGRVMLAGDTLRDALNRLCNAISRHSTHEQFAIVPVPGGIIVREQITLEIDEEMLHIVQQYVAALVRALCLMTGYGKEPLSGIELTPHPRLGLSHLKRSLGPTPMPSTSRTLSVFIQDHVLDRTFLPAARENGRRRPCRDWSVLRGERTFESTARHFIETMLEEGSFSVERFAAASGGSLRTVQRRLAAEGKSFTALLDEVRQARALRDLKESSKQIGHIAVDLGYSGQPAFVRAVRRWTGLTPRQIRQRHADAEQPNSE